MKKIDKLILGSFLGPFFLTFFVVIFILLSQFMLKYLDEIVGKDLDTTVIVQLIFYFSVFMTPNAFPLAVLLSSLMTFGNLGEHFELTALKGSGISLIRVMVPIFAFTLLLTGAAYYSNNFIVPKANLKAFSLLYDVKQMKPSMELKEGTFYNGIEGYSIKVGEKDSDGKTLKDLVIYDHTARQGNVHVTMADSGLMYNILNDRYLVLEMFDGNTYMQEKNKRKTYVTESRPEPWIRNTFDSQKIIFSLASFDLKRTKEELFSSNRLMKNSVQLRTDVDSMRTEYTDKIEEVKEHSFKFFDYHLQDIVSVYKQRALEREAKKRSEEEERERAEQEKLAQESAREIAAATKQVRENKISDEPTLTTPKDSTTLSEDNEGKIPTSSGLQEARRKRQIPDAVRKRNAGKRTFDFAKSTEQKKSKKENEEVDEADTLKQVLTFEENMVIIDSLMNRPPTVRSAFNRSLTHVRYVKNNMMSQSGRLEKLSSEINKFQLERFKKLSYAITILIMFLYRGSTRRNY